MQLTNLIATTSEISLVRGAATLAGVALDSRNVKPGFLFVAINGTEQDGRTYIPSAIEKGATAVLVDADTDLSNIPDSLAVCTTKNMRHALSQIAAGYYSRQPETVVAVTGTSGKTSTAQFTMGLWKSLGQQAASIGTLGLVAPYESHYAARTTPDAISLHQTLDDLVTHNVTHVAMEASSHGIVLNRLDGVKLKAAAFTNLSREHLDYHNTMQEYLAAKLRLFTTLLPHGAAAVLNADCAEYSTLITTCQAQKHHIISFGRKGHDITLKSVEPDQSGQRIKLAVMGKDYDLLFPVIGSFQVWNSLAALGLVIGSGSDPVKSTENLAHLDPVAGRLQLIGTTESGGVVFVDYAHKPDALENVLKGLRPHAQARGSKLGVVFGCGGNRDKGKRPIMGEIAQRLADWVIVTDDNPRHEEPDTIRKEILAGCKPSDSLREIGDRHEAIKQGIANLGIHDLLVIAGKGHEAGQIVGDQVLPFDDAAVAREFLGGTA